MGAQEVVAKPSVHQRKEGGDKEKKIGSGKKLPAPGRGGVYIGHLSEDEARVRTTAEIVAGMIDGCRKGDDVDLNALKSTACRKYGLARAPKLVEMIVALPDSYRDMVLPRL